LRKIFGRCERGQAPGAGTDAFAVCFFSLDDRTIFRFGLGIGA
jgi:hypothetical protein